MPGAAAAQPESDFAISMHGVCKDFTIDRVGQSLWSRLFGRVDPAASGRQSRIFRALDGITADIRRGETVGLLGINGAGKSTLLQMIAGTLTPTRGSIRVDGRISALLELGAGFNPDWTGRRNAEFQSLVLGAHARDIPAILKSVEDFADVGQFFDQPMRTYSSGMFARVAFATAIATDPEILIVDEALAVGDARFQNKCFAHFRRLQERGKTILFVSHDITMVTQFCTRGIVIDAGKVLFDGPSGDAAAAYLKRLYGEAIAPIKLQPRRVEPSEGPRGKPDADAIAKQFNWPPEPGSLEKRGFFNPHASSAGRATGNVVDAILLDLNDNPVLGPIKSGQRFRIALQIVCKEAIQRPSVGIMIKTKDNVSIYGVTNLLLGDEVARLSPGSAAVAVFEIDNNFGYGDFFVDIGLADLDGDEFNNIEWRLSLLHLSITSESDHYGLINLNADFDFTTLSQSRLSAIATAAGAQ